MLKPYKNKRAEISAVLAYLKPYRALLVLSLIFAFISAAFSLCIPVLVGKAIDCISADGVNYGRLFEFLAYIGGAAIISALGGWAMNICNNKITYNTVRDLRRDAFDKIHSLPISYLDNRPHGDILSRIVSDADQFADGLLMGVTQLFTGVITIIGTIVFMLMINPIITLVVILVTPLSLLVASFIAKKTHTMFKEMSKARGEATDIINESVNGQRVIKAFSREDETLESFAKANDKLAKCSLKAVFFSSITNPSTRFVNSLVYAAVGFAGAVAVINDPVSFTVGGLSSFLGYANQYTKPFNEISGVVSELQGALACATRLLEFIALEGEEDGGNADGISERSGTVAFEKVSFSYVPEKELLKNIDISAEKGMRIAIVGPTGCGKTTLINLLMRFYDVSGGKITVDGVDIRDMKRADLREKFGMVLQDTWIMDGSVRDNILLGKSDASDEEMIAAAKAVGAHSFIKRLPNGYDTLIGETKGGLSQGEKQLLCITRIMISPPPMLILDEATSSIDTRTEMKIQKAFETLMKGRTTFIVAHRLSTIENSDLILVMKDGNIIEQGTHKTLLEKGGFYKELYNSGIAKVN